MQHCPLHTAAPDKVRRLTTTVIIGALLLGVGGCDQPLEVDIPGRVQEQDLDNPALAATLVVGALGELECGFNQMVPTNAFLTGELISSNFFLDSNAWGRREEPFMRDSPSWREAQFIIGEARGGDEAIEAMNRVRSVHGLPPIAEEAIVDVLETILEERRREFFLEGQRHSDMIRHAIPFPSGLNHKGQIFQPYECMPLPNVERFNNPNIGG